MAQEIEFYKTGNDSSEALVNFTNNKTGQSFTIGTTGTNLDLNVEAVSILGKKLGTPGTLTIEIYNVDASGLTTGSAIASGTIAESSFTTSDTWVTSNLTTTTTLKRNTQYALVMTSDSGDDGSNNIILQKDASTPAYTGGNKLNWNGSVWSNDTTDDWLFIIIGGSYAGTLCTLADAVNKAGANANSTATNESLVSDFVRQSEGVINATTRFDWIAQYSSLTDQVKYILNEVASEMAAIKIITYDPSGYTDIVEAETMINVYRENVQRGLSLLRNQEVRRFMVNDS